MKYRILILLSLMLSLAGKAQTNEIQLDEDGIMRVGAPVTIVTIGNSITAGYSNTSAYWAWPAQLERMLGPEYQVKNYAVSGTTMNLHINASFRNTGNYPKAKAANPDILFIATAPTMPFLDDGTNGENCSATTTSLWWPHSAMEAVTPSSTASCHLPFSVQIELNRTRTSNRK